MICNKMRDLQIQMRGGWIIKERKVTVGDMLMEIDPQRKRSKFSHLYQIDRLSFVANATHIPLNSWAFTSVETCILLRETCTLRTCDCVEPERISFVFQMEFLRKSTTNPHVLQ